MTESQANDTVQAAVREEMQRSRGDYQTAWNLALQRPEIAAIVADMKVSPANAKAVNNGNANLFRGKSGFTAPTQKPGAPSAAGSSPSPMKTAMEETKHLKPGDRNARDHYPAGFAGGPQVAALRSAGWKP